MSRTRTWRRAGQSVDVGFYTESKNGGPPSCRECQGFTNNAPSSRQWCNIPRHTKRLVDPQTHAESSIGAWQLCLEMVGVVACLTNLLLAVLVSKNVDMYVPSSMAEQLGSFEAKVTTRTLERRR